MSDSDDQIYEVEEIQGTRIRNGTVQYLIKWKGYTEDENTWEDEENVYAKELIQDFYNKKLQLRSIDSTIQNKVQQYIQAYTRIDLSNVISLAYDITEEDGQYVVHVQYTDNSLGVIPYDILKKEVPGVLFDIFEHHYMSHKE